jgi:L-xylulokinase
VRTRCFLGLDSGGTFIKAAVYDASMKELAVARRGAAILAPRPGWAERDLEELWRDACLVIREAVARAGVAAADIAGVGISAQGKGLYILDKAGRPLERGVVSADQRAMKQVRLWQRNGVPGRLYPLTRQTLWTGHPATLLRWFRDNDPATYSRIGKIQMAHDLLRYRMTGEVACELTNISESNLYNMNSGRYDEALFDLLGIPEALSFMPPIVGSTETAGKITAAAAEATGLAKGTPVAGGLFDVVSTAICAGLADGSKLNAVMGTWSIATGLAEALTDDPEYNYVYGRHPDPGLYIAHDASPTSAANLQWLLDAFPFGQETDFSVLNAQVEALPKATGGVLFLPFITGSNAGLGMKGGLYGLQAAHGRAHVVQAVMEGIVFSLNVHLRRIRRLFPDATALRATGGPARSRPWMRMLADLSGLPVELPTVEETGCTGSALAAATGAGEFASMTEAAGRFSGNGGVVQPDASARDAYLEKERRYQRLVAAVRAMEDDSVGERKSQ